jgi:uncharacterized protein (UPF0212 family)
MIEWQLDYIYIYIYIYTLLKCDRILSSIFFTSHNTLVSLLLSRQGLSLSSGTRTDDLCSYESESLVLVHPGMIQSLAFNT